MIPGGEFIDPEGFFFNKQGFDELGGTYDGNGVYVAPPGITAGEDGLLYYTGSLDEGEEFDDYYDELDPDAQDVIDDEEHSDQEDDDFAEYYGLEQSEAILGMRREHCLPVINWVKKQEPKNWVIKIANIPRRASEAMVLKML